jgi:hypothetical protein
MDFVEYRRQFFEAVRDQPLDPTHKWYVPIYGENIVDPVRLLRDRILLSDGTGSSHLFAGYRGTGKSTELRRLKRELEVEGSIVLLVDLDYYLNPTAPIDITDFLLIVVAAFEEAARELLPSDALARGFWERVGAFLRRQSIDIEELSIGVAAGVEANLKASLKSDPTFKQRLQEALSGHLWQLENQIRAHLAEIVDALKSHHEGKSRLVLIVDSVEHLVDTSATKASVSASLQTVFTLHADRLRFPMIDVVFTIPPYLQILERAALSTQFGGSISTLTSIPVLNRTSSAPNPSGLATVIEVVNRRKPDWRELLDEQSMHTIVLASGGHLRDFIHLLRECIILASGFDTNLETIVRTAVRQVSKDYRMLVQDEAEWLVKLRETGEPPLETNDDRLRLARFCDVHLVLSYSEGTDEWFAVHPLAVPQLE